MNIPKVGQKYKCVASGWNVKVGDIIEIKLVEIINGGVFVEYSSEKGIGCWSVNSYPDEFKLVEESNIDQASTSTINVEPPLGLQSWQAHDSLRVQDILAAMQRYVAANKAVPNEWLEELINKLDIDHE